VFHQKDRHAALAQRQDAVGELAHFLGAHAGGRLVEQHQRRLGGKRPGHFEAALLAEGKIAGKLVALVVEPGEFQKLLDLLAAMAGARQPALQEAVA
jgi:hypothetical protein